MAPRRSVSSPGVEDGLNRRLRRWLARELLGLRPVVEARARAWGAEHSRKHVTSYQQVCLLLFHELAARRSLCLAHWLPPLQRPTLFPGFDLPLLAPT